jgi:SnoaL-like domain
MKSDVKITKEWAWGFAHDWIDAWNAHDLGRILSHYSDEFEMSSPFIRELAQEPSGMLKGKAQVGAYWRTALERLPDLHFELQDVFIGASSVTIFYKAVQGKIAAEVLLFNDEGQIYKALAHYSG